ncbi:MAG TPA: flagellar basal body-associated FliL family protein [Candidatus Brocadiia bacterium]|nr:flagellar basal body-associated FliL family protein [Candidatus Brocadiia bacterium]
MPDAAVEERKNAGEAAAKTSRGGKGILIAGVVLLVAAIGGGVAVASLLLGGAPPPPGAEAAAKASDKPKPDPIVYDGLDEVYVNVRGTQKRRFLIVKFSLTLRDLKAQEKFIKNQKAALHALIAMLMTKTLDELDEPDVTATVSSQARVIINEVLGGGDDVQQVFLTRFVVQ